MGNRRERSRGGRLVVGGRCGEGEVRRGGERKDKKYMTTGQCGNFIQKDEPKARGRRG